MPLPPFPTLALAKPAYRFLDSTGLPSVSGDVPGFSTRHFRADAGAAVSGVWRPVDADSVATLSVARGCLRIQGNVEETVAAHLLLQVQADVIVELLPEFGNLISGVTMFGVYIGVGNTGVGAALTFNADTTADLTESALPVARPFPYVTSLEVDLSDNSLPATLGTLTLWSQARQIPEGPVLLRVIRRLELGATVLTSYISLNLGHSWRAVNSTNAMDTTTPAVLGLLSYAASSEASLRVAGVKFLDPAAAIGLD